MKKVYDNQLDWLEGRRTGVGGSDIGIILEMSPWMTISQLAATKKNPIESQGGNPITEMGHIMEGLIFNNYVKKDYPNAESFDYTVFTDETAPHIQASPDAIAGTTLIEIKFVNLLGGTKWKNKAGEYELPDYYFAQVQAYLAAMPDMTEAKVYVFFQELADVKVFDVAKDNAFIESMLRSVKHFWTNLNTIAVMPEITSGATIEDGRLGDILELKNSIKKIKTKIQHQEDAVLRMYLPGTILSHGSIKGSVVEKNLKAGIVKRLTIK